MKKMGTLKTFPMLTDDGSRTLETMGRAATVRKVSRADLGRSKGSAHREGEQAPRGRRGEVRRMSRVDDVREEERKEPPSCLIEVY